MGILVRWREVVSLRPEKRGNEGRLPEKREHPQIVQITQKELLKNRLRRLLPLIGEICEICGWVLR
jgi:hypothetical protein